MALVGSDDMARCAPPHCYPLAVGGVGGEDGRCHDRGKDSKDGSTKRCALIDASSGRRRIDHAAHS
jgi:hypothetical protein